ncbi:MAG TPA: hypothetical protein VJA94_24855 [Candidatus Angelobacter sp.]
MKKNVQFAALIFAASIAAVAQTSNSKIFRLSNGDWVEQSTGTLPAKKTIKVTTTAGPIHLTGGQQNDITYTVSKRVRAGSEESARREFARLRFNVSSAGDVALLRGECDSESRGYVGFDLNVPAQTTFAKLETSGGAVSANNIAGRLHATTGGGSIQMDQIGEGFASSGGGNIEVGRIERDVRVETGGGSIKIGNVGGQIVASSGGGTLVIGTGKGMSLETGGGTIQVNQCTGAIKASTGGGSIYVKEVSGHAQVESGGGSIHVGPVRGGLRVETGSGPIMAVLANGGAAFTDSRLETSAGDIVVYIPDDLKVTIRAAVEVARGSGITSDFPGLKITTPSQQWGPREVEAEGALNGGGPLLHVHTTNGSIEFKRQK